VSIEQIAAESGEEPQGWAWPAQSPYRAEEVLLDVRCGNASICSMAQQYAVLRSFLLFFSCPHL
jgi:hypothetical protein